MNWDIIMVVYMQRPQELLPNIKGSHDLDCTDYTVDRIPTHCGVAYECPLAC